MIEARPNFLTLLQIVWFPILLGFSLRKKELATLAGAGQPCVLLLSASCSHCSPLDLLLSSSCRGQAGDKAGTRR